MSENLGTYDNSRSDINYSDRKNRENTYSSLYFFTILYLILDYGRPQDLLPIGFLRPLDDGFTYNNAINSYKFKIPTI